MVAPENPEVKKKSYTWLWILLAFLAIFFIKPIWSLVIEKKRHQAKPQVERQEVNPVSQQANLHEIQVLKQQIDDEMVKLTNQLNKQLPAQIDRITRLNNALWLDGKLTFNYQVSSSFREYFDEEFKKEKRKELVQFTCSNEAIKKFYELAVESSAKSGYSTTQFFKELNIRFAWRYSDETGAQWGEVEALFEPCA